MQLRDVKQHHGQRGQQSEECHCDQQLDHDGCQLEVVEKDDGEDEELERQLYQARVNDLHPRVTVHRGEEQVAGHAHDKVLRVDAHGHIAEERGAEEVEQLEVEASVRPTAPF